MKYSAAAFLAATILAGAVHAETPKLMPGPAVISAITPAGGLFPEGTFAAFINYSHADKDTWYRSGSSYSAHYPFGSGTQENNQDVAVLKLRYGLGNGWDIRTATPFVHNDFDNGSTLSPAPKKTGIADTMLVLRRQWMNENEGYPFNLGAGIGIQIPTGSTDIDRVGTGAWGIWAEAGITKTFGEGRHIFDADIGYLYRFHGGSSKYGTSGKQSDLLRTNARYAFAINSWIDIGVEAQYEKIFSSKTSGHSNHNSSDVVMAGPAINLKIPTWKTVIGFTAQFPLYADFEARWAKDPSYPTAASLGEKIRLEIKLTKRF